MKYSVYLIALISCSPLLAMEKEKAGDQTKNPLANSIIKKPSGNIAALQSVLQLKPAAPAAPKAKASPKPGPVVTNSPTTTNNSVLSEKDKLAADKQAERERKKKADNAKKMPALPPIPGKGPVMPPDNSTGTSPASSKPTPPPAPVQPPVPNDNDEESSSSSSHVSENFDDNESSSDSDSQATKKKNKLALALKKIKDAQKREAARKEVEQIEEQYKTSATASENAKTLAALQALKRKKQLAKVRASNAQTDIFKNAYSDLYQKYAEQSEKLKQEHDQATDEQNAYWSVILDAIDEKTAEFSPQS